MAIHQNKIEKLITELCPNGVEFKELGECVSENIGGGTPSKSVTAYWNGDIPWASVGDLTIPGIAITSTRNHITEEGLKKSSSHLIPKGSVIAAVKISPGKMKITDIDIAINQDLRGLLLHDFLTNRFLVYYFQTINVIGNGTIVKGITIDFLNKIKIPVPPLAVQEEIVTILNSFTQLEAELEAELEARKIQYEHYRQSLLEDDLDVQHKTLGEVFNMLAGHFISAVNISANQDINKQYPCYGGNGLRGYVNKKSHDGEYVLIGRQGALCGNVKRVEGEFYATEHAVVVSPKTSGDINWAFHMLTHMNLNQYASKSAQPGLAVGNLEKVKMNLPKLSEQKRIAFILDKFDALVNDISTGLPAELKARRQQYEYYRNKLLTFKEYVG